jgi:lysophospholipase L1-like esterase
VEFNKSRPGVLYSSLGVNGANITLLSHAFNGAHWAAELRHYRPDLVVLAYGTNESGFPKFVDSTWGGELKSAVKRLQNALPDASILLMSPMDRGVRNDRGEIETIDALPRLVKIEARVADETGVAFFNTFQAMGGEGTMARWYAAEPRLVGADYIHPMPAGAKIVGELLYGSLRDGYNEYKLRQLKSREPESTTK